jgi:uncharacterized membrane protein (DUF485 family)
MSEITLTPAERHNRRLGIILFWVYFLLYAAFVGIVVYDYRLMSQVVFAGLNLAIVYGMGLIVAALMMALLYTAMCHRDEPR